MPALPRKTVKPIPECALKPMDPLHQIPFRRNKRQVVMIAHDAVSRQLPAAAIARLKERPLKRLGSPRVCKKILPIIPPGLSRGKSHRQTESAAFAPYRHHTFTFKTRQQQKVRADPFATARQKFLLEGYSSH